MDLTEKKSKALDILKLPTSIRELRGALCLYGYYRKFIKDFARLAQPLTELLRTDVPKPWKVGKKPKNWTKEQIHSFETIKQKLKERPILGHPDWDVPFIIQTDGISKGIGAVLCQKIQKKEVVIMYASCSLNKAESSYTIPEIEALAVVWAIDVFKHYFECNPHPISVVTDHAALKWFMKRKDGSPRVMRWIMRLQ